MARGYLLSAGRKRGNLTLMSLSPSLLSAFRNATAEVHERLEKVPFSAALFKNLLPRVSIISLFHCLEIIHAALEHHLKDHSDARVHTLTLGYQSKLGALKKDLALISEKEHQIIFPAEKDALVFADEISKQSSHSLGIVGMLYVLEGSQNGGALLKKIYAKNLGVDADALIYFGFYGSQTSQVWRTFMERLSAMDLSETEQDQAVQGAVSAFSWIEKIYLELYPCEG